MPDIVTNLHLREGRVRLDTTSIMGREWLTNYDRTEEGVTVVGWEGPIQQGLHRIWDAIGAGLEVVDGFTGRRASRG